MRPILIVALLTACSEPAPPPPPPSPPPAPPAPVVAADGLPTEAMARDLIMGPCQICHSPDYMTHQRLTPAQWTATVKKMVAWGAPLTDEQATTLARSLAEAYPSDRPDSNYPRIEPQP